MEDFLGGAPPPPMSPASPTTYFSGPRLGISQAHSHSRQQEDDVHLTPGRAASKKTNRASTVSVMSGLGVPMADMPPSPSIARSPSSSSFLPTRKKMYNFFGHRPPSELISSHLAEYFPSAKKRELEKTVRHSMLRLSSGGGLGPRRGSIAPSIADSRRSIEALVGPSPPRKNGRPGSRGNLASPPTASIPEETETGVEERLPRVSVSNDGGEVIRASIDGESEDESVASIESRPPLLPPFETGGESFADSLQAFGPRIRPKSITASRRGSTGSTKSRMSMLSQIRRNRDRTDTASLLTVDEITAEVENRRASTITFEESDEETGDLSVAPRVADTGLPVSESEESEEEMESEEDSEEESDEDEDDDEGEADDADEDELGKAFTSTGCEWTMKSSLPRATVDSEGVFFFFFN
jgi:mitogen-activated protein kinase kinase kinase